MIFIGIALIILGSLLPTLRALHLPSVKSSGGVIIFIGPFPLAFSWGPHSLLVLLICSLLAVAILLALLIIFLTRREVTPKLTPENLTPY